MNEKIKQAFILASDLATQFNAGTLGEIKEGMDGIIWSNADGLKAKRLYNARDGRCSLAESMSFDPEKEEAQLDYEILEMEKLLKMAAAKNPITIRGVFVGYQDQKVIDLETGKVYQLSDDNGNSVATLTSEVWGDPSRWRKIYRCLNDDINLEDDDLLPLGGGHLENGLILDFNGTTGTWEL